jgi:hypothetical protein
MMSDRDLTASDKGREEKEEKEGRSEITVEEKRGQSALP